MTDTVEVTQADDSGCSCVDAVGENVDCPTHGIASGWSLEYRTPEEWQEICLGITAMLNEARTARHQASVDEATRELVGKCARVADAAEQEALNKLAKAEGADSRRNYAAASVAAQSIAKAIRATAKHKKQQP